MNFDLRKRSSGNESRRALDYEYCAILLSTLRHEVTTLIGHRSNVWCGSFTLDSSLIATSSSDETVRVWNVQGGQQVTRLEDHVGVVRCCHFSPDSTLLATCSWDKSIVIYRTADFQAVHKLLGHTYGVTWCQFSPSGDLLASCSWDDTIGLWDVQTGKLLQALKGHVSPVSACSFSVGGSTLASCSWDGTVRIWDLSFTTNPIILEGHPDAVYDVSYCPIDMNVVATCGRKGVLMVWDLRTRAPWQTLHKGWKEINSVSFSPDGTQIATGNDLFEIHLWDMKHSPIPEPITLHSHAGGVFKCTYSSDGRYLASCSSDHTCKIWDLSRPSESSVTQLAQSLATGLSLN